MRLRLARIDQLSDLEAIADEWWALWHRAPSATPFQSPTWLIPWWKTFAPGKLCVLAVKHGATLVGLAPFYVEPGGRALPLGISVSDYLDVLVDPDHLAPAGDVLSGAIVDGLHAGISAWALPELRPTAQALDLAPDAIGELHPGDVCPVLALPDQAQDLAEVVPHARMRKVRMARHRAARAGGYTIEVCGTPALVDALGDLVRLHAIRWAERGGGIFADERVAAFHREALPALDRAGLLRVLRCRIGGEVAGVYYGLRDGTCAYAYIGGFDPQQAYTSPGTLLIAAAIEDAVAAGAREFHFLRGDEPYKHAWGAVDRLNCCRIFRPLKALAYG
ncbi:GNAT family N-acetyltransferase [Chelatococcus reniformis]|uniref:Glycosyl transferase n=1 Tax=Chelatococcus reniformis TaxID=1494448 RepID=A0A916UMA9_9HYPH|nr:GNAT family N-acetyltransferase [Chelatococcus reniformis]GGC78447.1 glycosyl transferase [Chelatococcus reniformis]